MARRHRFHTPRASYHVMLRGNDGQPIFFGNSDRSRMCLLIQQGVERFGHSIEAFCFMSNHIHLAVRVADVTISRIMQHLAFRYTRYINRHYNRVGHLFQGRFKSVLIDDENYLKELIRYIHLNPVRAKLAVEPKEYPWSSHRAYMELDEFSWLTKDRVLKKFHPEREAGVSNYEKYVLQGIGMKTEFDFKSGCISGMMGDSEFVDEILLRTDMSKPRKIELTKLVAKVCEMTNLTPEQLRMSGKHKKHSEGRALLAYFVRGLEYVSMQSLARFLERDPSTLTQLASRFESRIINDVLIGPSLAGRVYLKQ